jgi:hypothetical protein
MWLASKLDVLQPVGDLLSKPTSMLPLFRSMLVNHALLGIFYNRATDRYEWLLVDAAWQCCCLVSCCGGFCGQCPTKACCGISDKKRDSQQPRIKPVSAVYDRKPKSSDVPYTLMDTPSELETGKTGGVVGAGAGAGAGGGGPAPGKADRPLEVDARLHILPCVPLRFCTFVAGQLIAFALSIAVSNATLSTGQTSSSSSLIVCPDGSSVSSSSVSSSEQSGVSSTRNVWVGVIVSAIGLVGSYAFATYNDCVPGPLGRQELSRTALCGGPAHPDRHCVDRLFLFRLAPQRKLAS